MLIPVYLYSYSLFIHYSFINHYSLIIKTQLKEKHFQTLEDAMMEAKLKDREKWRAIVQDRSFLADNGHQ